MAASDLGATADALQRELRLPAPYADPGIAEFGLANAVFASGDTFLEIVSPVEEGTTAGRFLERRGGDAGYMAIFQVEDLRGARERLADLGVRVVWQVDLPDMAGTHLHPRDVPGAIVSLDRPDPPESWRWAGPRWTGSVPADRAPGGIVGVTVTTSDPAGLAARWAAVLGTEADGSSVQLDGGRQQLAFVVGDADCITDVRLAQAGPARELAVGGVRFHLEEIR